MSQEISTASKSATASVLQPPKTTSNLVSNKIHQKNPIAAIIAKGGLQEPRIEPSTVVSADILEEKPFVATVEDREKLAFSSEQLPPAGSSETAASNNRASAETEPPPQNTNLTRVEAVTVSPTLGSGVSEEELQLETDITGQIVRLWNVQKKRTISLRQSRRTLNETKEALCEQLFELKRLLMKPGRDGQWNSFLRRENIPRATADRYVERHRRSLEPEPVRCLTEASTGPTEEAVTEMVNRLKPKLTRFLTSPDSIAQFTREIALALRMSDLLS
jgi:hypothetical protein